MASYSGLWNGVHNENHALSGSEATLLRQVGKLIKKKGFQAIAEKARELNGIAVGTTPVTSVTYNRVPASTLGPSEAVKQGGLITAETATLLSGTGDTDEQTEVANLFAYSSSPTYVADLANNGATSIG